jgi:hypothetical protein
MVRLPACRAEGGVVSVGLVKHDEKGKVFASGSGINGAPWSQNGHGTGRNRMDRVKRDRHEKSETPRTYAVFPDSGIPEGRAVPSIGREPKQTGSSPAAKVF